MYQWIFLILVLLSLGVHHENQFLHQRFMEKISAGNPWPFGVRWIEEDNAFNFSLYSKYATGVILLCYTEKDPAQSGI